MILGYNYYLVGLRTILALNVYITAFCEITFNAYLVRFKIVFNAHLIKYGKFRAFSAYTLISCWNTFNSYHVATSCDFHCTLDELICCKIKIELQLLKNTIPASKLIDFDLQTRITTSGTEIW